MILKRHLDDIVRVSFFLYTFSRGEKMNYQQAYDCEWAVPKEVQNVYIPELKPQKAKCRGLRCESNLESDRRDLGQNIYGSVFKRA